MRRIALHWTNPENPQHRKRQAGRRLWAGRPPKERAGSCVTSPGPCPSPTLGRRQTMYIVDPPGPPVQSGSPCTCTPASPDVGPALAVLAGLLATGSTVHVVVEVDGRRGELTVGPRRAVVPPPADPEDGGAAPSPA